MEVIKVFENGKLLKEFTDAQEFGDYILDKTKRSCQADHILSVREIKKESWANGFVIGLISGIALMSLLANILF